MAGVPLVETERSELIDSLPGLVFVLRHGGDALTFHYVNAGAMPLCGLRPQELLQSAQPLLRMIDPHDLPAFHSTLRASAMSGFWNWEGRLHTAGGPKWVNVRAQTRALDPLNSELTGIMLNVTQSRLRESQLRDLSVDMRHIASNLESVREAERARMARDLHDDLGQILTALQMDVALLRRQSDPAQTGALFDNVGRLIRAASDAGRRVAAELRPTVLDLGLEAALSWLAQQYSGRYAVDVEVDFASRATVGELIATELYRIAQEALTNVVRHAQARHAWIRCADAAGGEVCLTVDDDGRGYSAPHAVAGRPALGLRGMRERAAVFGGSFELDRSPRGGVRIRVCLPVMGGGHE